jgi:hypothetical protein
MQKHKKYSNQNYNIDHESCHKINQQKIFNMSLSNNTEPKVQLTQTDNHPPTTNTSQTDQLINNIDNHTPTNHSNDVESNANTIQTSTNPPATNITQTEQLNNTNDTQIPIQPKTTTTNKNHKKKFFNPTKGHNIKHKPPKNTRFIYYNINSLRSKTTGNWKAILEQIQRSGIDVTGLCETSTNWSNNKKRNSLKKILRLHFKKMP